MKELSVPGGGDFIEGMGFSSDVLRCRLVIIFPPL